MKKPEKSIDDKKEVSDEKILQQFAEYIFEEIKLPKRDETDAFEAYMQRVRSTIYSNKEQFCLRFSKGYFLLMQGLLEKQYIEKKKEK